MSLLCYETLRVTTRMTYQIFFCFQSIQSSCENEPIDLNGLHESVVDSDEDLTDSMDVSCASQVVNGVVALANYGRKFNSSLNKLLIKMLQSAVVGIVQ